jgi:hypothetical protein
MSRHPHEELRRWLEAEHRGDETAAEEALGALFTATPRPAPRAGFAERVMLAARLPQAVPAASLAAAPGLSSFTLLAAATAVVALAALLAAQPLLTAFGIGELGPATLLQGLGALVARTSHLFVSLLLVARKAVDLGRGISLEAVRNPGVAAGVLLVYLIAGLTFRALSRLVARERNFRYASA